MRILFLFSIITVLYLPLAGQTPGYLHFTVEDGLPGNLVYCMVQDREGYYWFGTDKGLSRFDGERFVNYGVDEGLPDPEVLTLFEDSEKRLWMGCFRKKPAYRQNGIFYTEKTDPLLEKLTMATTGYVFYEEPDTTLWITSGVNARLKNNQLLLAKGPKMSGLRRIGNDLVGFSGSCLYDMKLQADTLQSTLMHCFGLNRWSNAVATSGNRFLYAFPEKTILVAYQDGKIIEIDSLSTRFRVVATDRQGRFWGCAPGIGAVCFDNSSRNFSNPVTWLPGKKIINMYEDDMGNIWLLSSGDGVYMLPKNRSMSWKQTDGLTSSNILTLAKNDDGAVMAGDDMGNILFFKNGQLQSSIPVGPKGANNFVRKILPLKNNRTLIAIDLSFYFLQENRVTSLQRWVIDGSLKLGGAPKAALIRNDSLWLGSSSGLAVMGPQEAAPKLINLGRITALCTDDEGIIWKGGIDGLSSASDQFQKNWGDEYPLLKNRIVTIVAGGKGKLWVVTPEDGLLELAINAGKIRKVTQVNSSLSQPVKNIKNVCARPDGSLWLSTNAGICRIGADRSVSHFTTRHGLAGNEVNDLLISGDTIWAATANGLTIMRLSELSGNPAFQTQMSHFSYTVLDSVMVTDLPGRSHIPLSITLPANARNPVAFFAGLHQHQNDQLDFQHVLTPAVLPFPWFTFGNLLHAVASKLGIAAPADTLLLGPETEHFAQLDPGKYKITTTAITQNNVPSNMPLQWQLTVMPHWYQTIWPWLLLLAIAVYVARTFYQLRTRNLSLEAATAQLKLQALRAQINPHFVGNSINAIQQFFYPPDPEKASEYIYLFTVLLRKTLLFSEKDFLPFNEELLYDTEYLEMIQLRYAEDFRYEITGTENIPPGALFPAMLLQPVLENATIHGLSVKGISQLHLHFEMDRKRLCCTVTDNGPGINVSRKRKQSGHLKHQSKGLELLENKVKMLNRIHHTDLKMEWTDLTETSENGTTGTRVFVSFTPPQLPVYE